MPYQGNSFEHQRKLAGEVEQLRIHYRVKRTNLSKTIKDMIDYCQSNIQEDPLIYPVKENPFKEKKSCTILWLHSVKGATFMSNTMTSELISHVWPYRHMAFWPLMIDCDPSKKYSMFTEPCWHFCIIYYLKTKEGLVVQLNESRLVWYWNKVYIFYI